MLRSETYTTPDNDITRNTASPSKATMSQQQVSSYMGTVNGGGDPVTALAYRNISPSQSTAERHSQVQQDLHTALARLGSSQPPQ